MRYQNGVVIWDRRSATEFKSAYTPEFDSVPNAKLKRFFHEATLIIKNSPYSEVQDCCERISLYNLLIAWKVVDDGRGVGVVGTITSASQGSVTLGLKTPDKEEVPFPYNTNGHGITFWEATAKYRTVNYVADPYRRPRRTYR